jgi:hypothetical protein
MANGVELARTERRSSSIPFAAISQARVHPAARAYLGRQQAEGRSRREALRCLKRQLARVVSTTLKNEPLLT